MNLFLKSWRSIFARREITTPPVPPPATVIKPVPAAVTPPSIAAATTIPKPLVKPAPVMKSFVFTPAPVAMEPSKELKFGETRYLAHPAGFPEPVTAMNAADAVCAIWHGNMWWEPDFNPELENGVTLFLNSRNRITGALRSQGDSDSVPVARFEIVTKARGTNSPRVIFSHSHPKGTGVEPSRADLDFSADLHRYLRASRIELIDSVVVGTEGRFFSFRQSPLWAVVTVGWNPKD